MATDINVYLDIDDAAPKVEEPRVATHGGGAYIYVRFDDGLELWATEPLALRRLAEKLLIAADQLEDLKLTLPTSPSRAERLKQTMKTVAGYPAEWPRCRCGAPVLDGHLTCGAMPCDEASVRAARDREF